MSNIFPYLGFGIGLRPCHYRSLLEQQHNLDWLEIITEDFLVDGGPSLHFLEKICSCYPVVLHGVSLSIGSSDPLDQNYLKQLKALADRIKPQWISDHLCWTGVKGVNTHALLPLPLTEETLKHVVKKIITVQDYLGQQILLENIASYVDYKASEMTEWEFISAVAEGADTFILLDINNAYINAFNHRFNVLNFINALPKDRVKQFHIAGHDHRGTHIIDTHDAKVADDVWSLYEVALQRFGATSTLIERDKDIPELPEMLVELDRARTIYQKVVYSE